jgi:hypothetical protein
MEKFFEKAMYENIRIGFEDDNGFRELEDATFSYFSKYSDSQLDTIYEANVRAREIIDKIREKSKLADIQ